MYSALTLTLIFPRSAYFKISSSTKFKYFQRHHKLPFKGLKCLKPRQFQRWHPIAKKNKRQSKSQRVHLNLSFSDRWQNPQTPKSKKEISSANRACNCVSDDNETIYILTRLSKLIRSNPFQGDWDFFVPAKMATKMLWHNAIFRQIWRAPFAAPWLRLHLSVVRRLCKVISTRRPRAQDSLLLSAPDCWSWSQM